MLVGWYVLLATLLVWLPVLAYLLLGNLVVAWLDTALRWLGRHTRPVTVYTLALIGAVLIVDGARLL